MLQHNGWLMTRARLFQQRKTLLKLFVERTSHREPYQAASLVGTALLIGMLAGLGAVAFDSIVHSIGYGSAGSGAL